MNPHTCRVVLRPRNPLDVLDLTVRLMYLRGRAVSRIALWTLVPLAVGLLGLWALDLNWWALLAMALCFPLIRAPFTALGGRLLFADDANTREVLWTTLRLSPGFSLAWGVHLFALVATSCSGVGVLLFPVIAWLPETALLERVDVGRGVRRAARLAAAHPVHAALAAVSGPLLTVWGALLGEQVGQTLVGFVFLLGEPFGTLLTGTVTPYAIVGTVLVQPLVAWYRLMLYVDGRTRAEGWDLQVALRALDLGTDR